uniref:WD_REPEATS_REGION domain-containing protein n=1 Tax=Macrostomum lignano TaxID=282301 RepID=A0A1I8FQW5_9PLAT
MAGQANKARILGRPRQSFSSKLAEIIATAREQQDLFWKRFIDKLCGSQSAPPLEKQQKSTSNQRRRFKSHKNRPANQRSRRLSPVLVASYSVSELSNGGQCSPSSGLLDCPALSEALVCGFNNSVRHRLGRCYGSNLGVASRVVNYSSTTYFASVTALQALKSSGTLLLLTGSSSGKLELWDPAGDCGPGPCLMADQLVQRRVTDLQVYDGERGWASLTRRRQAGAAAGRLLFPPASWRWGVLKTMFAAVGLRGRVLPCRAAAVLSMAAGGGGVLQRLQRSPASAAVAARLPSACGAIHRRLRRCGLGVQISALLGSPVTAVKPTVWPQRLVPRHLHLPTVCCFCRIPCWPLPAFDYLAGASFLQVEFPQPKTRSNYETLESTVFEPPNPYASLGKTDSNHAGLVYRRILCLAAINSGNSGPRGDSAFTLISGGVEHCLDFLLLPACHKSSGNWQAY